jgi:hypothetical protein
MRDPDVAKHLARAELDRMCGLDFHFKEIDRRFKNAGL